MSMPHEPEIPELPQRLATRELLLAQALDACITAERQRPGAAQKIIAQQPAWARTDLHRMMSLVGSLDAAASEAHISPEFRTAARNRLMQRIGGESALEAVSELGPRLTALPSRTGHYQRAGHRSRWMWRGSAGLLAAVLGVAATLTASASALPGEPLYNVKQAQEAINVRLAADDQARALALLGQADARLDETARLLDQGRTDAALETTQRYGQVVERATATYIVTMDDSPQQASGTRHVETRLTQDQDQLQTILQTAPEPARADLREALVITRRDRALVADPRSVEQALGKSPDGRSVVAAAVPTTAAEDLPTAVPTRRPTSTPQPTPPPAPSVVVAQATEEPKEPAGVARQSGPGRSGDSGERGQITSPNAQNTSANSGRRPQPTPKSVVSEDQHGDDVAISPAVVARDDGDTPGRGASTDGRPGLPAVQSDGRNATQSNDTARGDDHEDAQAVGAHQAVAPVTTSESRSGGSGPGGGNDKPSGDGGAGQTTAPVVAASGDKPNISGGTHDDGDSRPVATAQPTQTAQPSRLLAQVTPTFTPTPTPTRKVDGDGTPRPTAVPTRSPTASSQTASSPTPSGGGSSSSGGGGGGDGHDGDH